jgi:hypothetical protein
MQSLWLLSKENYTMLDYQALLLVSIFQKAHPINPAPSANEYLQHFEVEIDGIGRVFKLLGLAEPNSQSELGWKPTPLLMDIVAERVVHPSKDCNKRVTPDDRAFVDRIMNFGLHSINVGDDYEEIAEFILDVLIVMGLLKKGASGYMPTDLMHKLILNRCLQQFCKGK